MVGMFDIQDIDDKVTVGNGSKVKATKVGICRHQVVQLNVSPLDIVIKEVTYLPDLCANSKIPGIDVNESFAPVVNDVSFCIMLIAKSTGKHCWCGNGVPKW